MFYSPKERGFIAIYDKSEDKDLLNTKQKLFVTYVAAKLCLRILWKTIIYPHFNIG